MPQMHSAAQTCTVLFFVPTVKKSFIRSGMAHPCADLAFRDVSPKERQLVDLEIRASLFPHTASSHDHDDCPCCLPCYWRLRSQCQCRRGCHHPRTYCNTYLDPNCFAHHQENRPIVQAFAVSCTMYVSYCVEYTRAVHTHEPFLFAAVLNVALCCSPIPLFSDHRWRHCPHPGRGQGRQVCVRPPSPTHTRRKQAFSPTPPLPLCSC